MIMEEIIRHISESLKISVPQVARTIQLLEDENTIPFIARYRKEMTGGLDEVSIEKINESYIYSKQLAKRKDEIIQHIAEQGKLTGELEQKIRHASILQKVEDLYLPYRKKRRTRATVAKAKGLEPLADWLMSCPAEPIEEEAGHYVSEAKQVRDVDEALQGAADILAERLADRAELRALARKQTTEQGVVCVRAKHKELDTKGVYTNYYDYQERVQKIVPHRILAINRGEKEGILKISIEAPDALILPSVKTALNPGRRTTAAALLNACAEDAYYRFIAPAVERELRQTLTKKAEQQAIRIFSENLHGLLLQPPLKARTVLGVDPAYRTGCKLAVVDPTGKVLDISIIYPNPPKSDQEGAKRTILQLIERHRIDIVAIGNGTASRETEAFIAETLKQISERRLFYIIVNEAGASVYSASKLARTEFPDLHVEERSAVSIARRLQDPLAELVKVDPKAVGVGEYQHDVSQRELEKSLQFVVETVVNQVGVNINTASGQLLQYVAGLSKTVAENIVAEREKIGRFNNRRQLMNVPRLGSKAFEQSAGFLRISNGENPLDNTPIHPESYKIAARLLEQVGCELTMIGTSDLAEKLKHLDVPRLAVELSVGEPTLRDVLEALARPGRDPRDNLKKPLLKSDVLKMEDLRPGMQLEGTIRNVVDFGAFVDIGFKQDGLVHLSKLAARFVRHPLDVVRVGEIVTVWVEQVDSNKGRIALTMIAPKN
ncbi:RNA-binding transcriptional accessory protein [Sporolactobacillus sp. CPB3-1]|uniref:RNA-binding transcriptional accessory protein n=2 Tax=Sporolactobacillus mangiferae TaxID=2940498 RepID=A0ABT0MDM3_9BACL|nr:Tex family protein [Sporolactobacillus mangiferae]MCL1632359.1 RNA-binding transcriptional accessory protein [Sporolactobacillus mangiferae]